VREKEQESEGRAGVLHIFCLCVDVGALGEELVNEAELAAPRRPMEGSASILRSGERSGGG
jgi:hypothetical protein